jgi:PKD repeat protein
VQSGPSASHKYAAPGRYIVTATATDSAGASSVAATAIEAKATAPGVTIFGPGNSATVNWPTTLTASANSGAPITRMNVYIDGQLAYATDRGVVNTALKVFTGTHNIAVQAFDSSGASQQASINVVAEPGDLPPTAVVSVRTLTGSTVLACSAGSHDPDGFLLFRHFAFSDGSQFYTPAAVHTLAGPGSYSVNLTVTDQFGASASASQNFSTSSSSPVQGAQTFTLQSVPAESPQRQPEPIRRP